MEKIRTKPVKVYPCGLEGNRWALDQDFQLTCSALKRIGVQVELTPLAEAQIIHTVWDEALDRISCSDLTNRFVICHICTNVFKMFENPAAIRRRDMVHHWVTQTKEATQTAKDLKLPHSFVPYAYDADIFYSEHQTREDRIEARRKLGIPDSAFLIGNFMRDSLGVNLNTPKPEKGADLFLEIISGLKDKGIPVHVLLAGPRRHWLRHRLAERNIPFIFEGNPTEEDDVQTNILSLNKIATLYRLLDLYLITSRHEGGPRAVLEAAASRAPVLSTPVGLAKDILHPSCLYDAVDTGIDRIHQIVRHGYDITTLDLHEHHVKTRHNLDVVAKHFADMYRSIASDSVVVPHAASSPVQVKFFPRLGVRHKIRQGIAHMQGRNLPGLGLRISLWHEFRKPPYGGGNQFMMALAKGLNQLGVDVVTNRLDRSVDVHICNSAWFDAKILQAATKHERLNIIHRVDGAVGVARGTGDHAEDDRIYHFNAQLASATVYQSAWCFKQLQALGYVAKRPVIIRNSVNGDIFNKNGRLPWNPHRKVRLISSSWSDNPRKGGPLFKWLDHNLNFDRFEYTFVGRVKETFDNIRHIPPLSSERLARLLKQHDIYIMASRGEACSNALIEALACGLPALYLNDGGNPELVLLGGLPFHDEHDILGQLDRISSNYPAFQNCIHVEDLTDVAYRYLNLARNITEM